MITEGWWETYSWLIGTSRSLYADIGLKFPPLYVHFIKLATEVFGSGYLQLRYFMVFVNLVASVTLYFFLRCFAERQAALIATGITIGLVMSNPVYLAKDYHTLVNLFVVSVFYLLARLSTEDSSRRLSFHYWAIGILCGLLLVTKQNIGVFFSLGVSLYVLIMTAKRSKNRGGRGVLLCLFFPFGYIIPIILITYLDPGWAQIFSGNDAKGSLFVVLFRFLADPGCLRFLIAAAVVVIASYVLNFRNIEKSLKLGGYIFCFPERFKVLLFLLFVAVLSIKLQSALIVLALAWPLVRINPAPGFKNYSRVSPSPHMYIPLYAYAYCGTQTAGYNALSTNVLLAIFMAEVIDIFLFRLKKETNSIWVYSLIAPMLFAIVISPKLFAGVCYNWWGLKSDGIMSRGKVTLPFSELSGIRSDPATAKMFEFVAAVGTRLNTGDSVFAYPSIPIVYSLLKIKPTGSAVLWFDVSTYADGKRTIEQLDAKLPRFIFWLRPPVSVYDGHFKLRKSDPAMLEVDEWLIHRLCSNQYKISKMVLSYDPEFEYKTLFKKHDGAIHRCDSVSGNRIRNEIPDESKSFNFHFDDGNDYKNYLNSSNELMDVDDHVFYVLERVL